MANTTVTSALQVEKWRKEYFAEYVRDSRFKRYMGETVNAPIQMVRDLKKAKGDTVNVPLLTRLQGSGVTGDNTLEGNEEAIGNYNHQIVVDQLRNAVSLGHMADQSTELDLLNAAKPMLKSWSMEQLRDDIIAAMGSPALDGTVYASATEAQKDLWLDANTDRILFGSAIANLSQSAPAGGATNDHSASLANVDSTNDTLTASLLSLVARLIKTADPHIRPIRVSEDEEYYIGFVPSLAMRDLRADSTMAQANRDARERGKDNPLFRGGDLIYDSLIIREVPEIAVISGVGAGSIDVAPCYFCGAQAVGVAWAEEPKEIMDTRDYGNVKGRGISEIRGVDKLMFNSVQHGLFTLYVSGVADA